MTLEDLGNLGELIAAIATLGTLIYLAMQIRQNSESVRVNAGQTILTSLNTALQSASSSPQQARVLILGQTDFYSLPEDEQAQFIVWIFAWFRVLEQAYHYHKKGILDDEVWDGHISHLTQILKSPAIKGWWEIRHNFFSDAFQEFVNRVALTDTDVLLPREMIERIKS